MTEMSCITLWCCLFCSTQECDGGAVGFVGNLGVCKCKVNSTDDICDMQCRSNQRRRIELDCSDPPRLIINPVDGEVSHTILEFNLFLPSILQEVFLQKLQFFTVQESPVWFIWEGRLSQ